MFTSNSASAHKKSSKTWRNISSKCKQKLIHMHNKFFKYKCHENPDLPQTMLHLQSSWTNAWFQEPWPHTSLCYSWLMITLCVSYNCNHSLIYCIETKNNVKLNWSYCRIFNSWSISATGYVILISISDFQLSWSGG